MANEDAREIKVSVIVPVHNTEKYLEQCLDSIVSQTLKEIEIICVDDGSTDRSVKILKMYAAEDDRVQILYQEHKFAGTARNLGKSIAKGKYLVFWDSDDYFYENALEEMYNKCEEDEADICICSARQYFEDGDFEAPGVRYIRKKEMPDDMPMPFNRRTAPDNVVSITAEAPWNKMFRREFIEKRGIDFKEIRNANDVFFVETALCLAERITLVNKELVVYRKGRSTGLVASVDKGLLNALHTWVETAEYLKEIDAFPDRSFANRALESIIYLLNNCANWDAFKEGFLYLQSGALDVLSIHSDVEDDYYYINYHKEAARRLREDSPEQYCKWIGNVLYRKNALSVARRRSEREKLKSRIGSLNNELKDCRKRADNYKQKNEILRNSISYRIGRKMTWLPRNIKWVLKGSK